jgi:hypothetical protein
VKADGSGVETANVASIPVRRNRGGGHAPEGSRHRDRIIAVSIGTAQSQETLRGVGVRADRAIW